MKHPDKVEKYNGTLEELAKAVGNMKYDKTAEFIERLADELLRQAKGDYEKGRTKLAYRLRKTATRLYNSKKDMDKVWEICEPYMKE